MYTVMMTHNFDGFNDDAVAYLFDTEEEAVKGLEKLWEDYYNTELAESITPLDEERCFHEDDYAIVRWVDGDYTEFHMALLERYKEC